MNIGLFSLIITLQMTGTACCTVGGALTVLWLHYRHKQAESPSRICFRLSIIFFSAAVLATSFGLGCWMGYLFPPTT